jgi:diadenosine tetraphosphate (Ap4A) HIT family hydrolase
VRRRPLDSAHGFSHTPVDPDAAKEEPVPEATCPMCEMLEGLKDADEYRSSGGHAITRKIADLPSAVAILGHDQYYRGYTLVVARTHAEELYQVSEREAAQYFSDMLQVARAIASAFKPRKMNYELLGNTVAHLHWHLFPRYSNDPNPQRPVWERDHDPVHLSDGDAAGTVAAIRRHLG